MQRGAAAWRLGGAVEQYGHRPLPAVRVARVRPAGRGRGAGGGHRARARARTAAADRPGGPGDPARRRAPDPPRGRERPGAGRSEAHTTELQSLMRISYAVLCLKNKTHPNHTIIILQPPAKLKQ